MSNIETKEGLRLKTPSEIGSKLTKINPTEKIVDDSEKLEQKYVKDIVEITDDMILEEEYDQFLAWIKNYYPNKGFSYDKIAEAQSSINALKIMSSKSEIKSVAIKLLKLVNPNSNLKSESETVSSMAMLIDKSYNNKIQFKSNDQKEYLAQK